MNESYLDYYFSMDGEVKNRSLTNQICIKIFAGTKYYFDRLFALLLLIALSPIMLLIAILIKLDSKGPVLFRQLRTGKNGENFYVLKFRTMVANNDVHDFSKQDKHTRVGAILRKTSLDELPQLINIVRAEMSFIGPRPWITDYFDAMNDAQRRRTAVRPGITGLAQANGRNEIDIFSKIKYDLDYIENYSFWMDITVILLTVKAVFTAKGADAGKMTIQEELSELRKTNHKFDTSKECNE